MTFNPDKPFNDLPLLPPKVELETPEILKACIKANMELAKLKMAERLIPNQTVLINTIPLLESQASSAIENIVTTTDDLFQFADSDSASIAPEIKETLLYRTALRQGLFSIKERPLSISTACEICSTIRKVDTNVRKLPGTKLINDFTGEIIYTPPEGEERLRMLLTNWQNYLHASDNVDPLIKLAVQHYQFEAIHPFQDGNGRTGRIINLLYLIDQDLLETPVLYLSKYFIQHKPSYYSKLLNVTNQQLWSDWTLFFLDAVQDTAKWTTKKILAIQELIINTCNYVNKEAPAIYDKDLVELLFVQPYVRINNLVESKICSRFTASKYLKKLCSIGTLVEIQVGREKLFINRRFLDLLKEK